MKATFKKYSLNFKTTAKTSRETLRIKETWFIVIWNDNNKSIQGIGECAMFKGLSCDDVENYEQTLDYVCKNINSYKSLLDDKLEYFPSIRFGLETAINDLTNKGERIIFESDFTRGVKPIPINGLIWMGSNHYMQTQIDTKIEEKYNCIKLKIGSLEFQKVVEIIEYLRKKHPKCEIRLDANGAFSYSEAKEKLKILSQYNIHSIEQPIKQGQPSKMARLCEESNIDITLDEELIGVNSKSESEKLIRDIKPQYVILKPALVGGFSSCDRWIRICEESKIKWWITSALESNIGLNAIAQYTSTKDNNMYQGLGTGQLFTNNIESPLEIVNTKLIYKNAKKWNIEKIFTQ